MDQCEFLAFHSTSKQRIPIKDLPPPAPGITRVVCISDTHNEHGALTLPWGHLLVHAGDVLTESGRRHVKWSEGGKVAHVRPSGLALVDAFGEWLGGQPHPHKLVIGGNHDLVLQLMGREAVQETLAKHSAPGTVIYLDHEAASVGSMQVFGSPYARWGSHNNAFYAEHVKLDACPVGTHILVTHIPAIVQKPHHHREEKEITAAIARAGCLLHVGGHWHWAHGQYFTAEGHVPCAVASVSASWVCDPANLTKGPSGNRGDPTDESFGGYNVQYPSIVVDIAIPGGPPDPSCVWSKPCPTKIPPQGSTFQSTKAHASSSQRLPLLLLGPRLQGPGTTELEHLLERQFTVDRFETESAALQAAQRTPYAIAIVHIIDETMDNVAAVLQSLKSHDNAPSFIAVVLQNSVNFPDLPLHCNLLVDLDRPPSDTNDGMVFDVQTLLRHLEWQVRHQEKPSMPPALLYFSANHNYGSLGTLLSTWRKTFVVHAFNMAEEAVKAIQAGQSSYFACVAKLGTADNKGLLVMRAMRKAHGSGPFMAVFSDTAANNVAIQHALNAEIGVDLFAAVKDGPCLTQRLMDVATARGVL